MAGVFHISEEEAAKDFGALMKRVHQGEEIVVEVSGKPVMRIEPIVPRRSIAEARAILGGRREAELESLAGGDGGNGYNAAQTPNAGGPGRPAEDIIRGLAEWQAKHGKIVLDEDFADDMEEIHRLYNQPRDDSKWD